MERRLDPALSWVDHTWVAITELRPLPEQSASPRASLGRGETRCRLRRALGLGAAIGGLVALCPLHLARAQTDGAVEAVHVVYTAPPECPAEQSFFDAVRSRTARVRRTQSGEAARTFAVVVERSGAGYRAALDVVDVAGAVNRREVDGADCAEVVSAVALVAALAVDPAAVASPSGVAPVTVAPEATATPPPIVANTPPAPSVVPALREPAPESRPSPPVRYRWSVGGGGEVRFAAVPAVAPGGAIHVDVAPTNGVFVPSFRLSAHAVTTRVDRTGITADLTWWSSRWDVCPLRAAALPLVVEACGVLELGALTSSGSGVERPSTATRFWGAAGFSPRLRWLATPSVELSFESALEFPFRRYDLTYATPGAGGSQVIEFLQMSSLSLDLVLAAAYRFP